VKSHLLAVDGAISAQDLTQTAEQGMKLVELDFPWTVSSTPATREFQSAMEKYAPNVGTEMGAAAVYGWVSGQLLAAAVKASNSSKITAASIKKGLYALPKGDTLGGIAPPLSFTPGKPTAIDCYFVEQIANDHLTLPQGLTTSCAPPRTVSALTKKLFP
jgi:branched-chain amino acid transport system substrate-binding protein